MTTNSNAGSSPVHRKVSRRSDPRWSFEGYDPGYGFIVGIPSACVDVAHVKTTIDDARLIAKAQELFNLLLEARQFVDGCDDLGERIDAAIDEVVTANVQLEGAVGGLPPEAPARTGG